ncbi:hypothetical protein Tco_0053817 [Tanacetum coccineum]
MAATAGFRPPPPPPATGIVFRRAFRPRRKVFLFNRSIRSPISLALTRHAPPPLRQPQPATTSPSPPSLRSHHHHSSAAATITPRSRHTQPSQLLSPSSHHNTTLIIITIIATSIFPTASPPHTPPQITACCVWLRKSPNRVWLFYGSSYRLRLVSLATIRAHLAQQQPTRGCLVMG